MRNDATLISDRPPGQQGPSYPVPQCPQGSYWDAKAGQCVVNQKFFNGPPGAGHVDPAMALVMGHGAGHAVVQAQKPPQAEYTRVCEQEPPAEDGTPGAIVCHLQGGPLGAGEAHHPLCPHGAGHATLRPAQPPGRQGPSYPVASPPKTVGQLFPRQGPNCGYDAELKSWVCVGAGSSGHYKLRGAGALMRNETPPDVSGKPPSAHPGCVYIVHAAGPNNNPPAWTQYYCE